MNPNDMKQEGSELEKLKQILEIVSGMIKDQEAEMGGGEEQAPAQSFQEKLGAAMKPPVQE